MQKGFDFRYNYAPAVPIKVSAAKKSYFIDRAAIDEIRLPKALEQAVNKAAPLTAREYESAQKAITIIKRQYAKLEELLMK